MKRRQITALCASTIGYLCSRNNDINGYWGIGVLCNISAMKGHGKLGFRLRGGEKISIFGCELTNSEKYTEALFALGIDKAEGVIHFMLDGRYSNIADKYLCFIGMTMKQDDRIGMALNHIHCWRHDPSMERRRIHIAVPKI